MAHFSDEEVERYARHLVLREIGGPGQQRLKGARVLIVGAGISGIGSAYHLKTQCPDRSYVVLEAQDSFGGTWLSLGMSGDLEAAIATRATHVRVGTAVFGARPPL